MAVGSLSFIDWVVFAVVGRLLLFLFMKAPYSKWVMKIHPFFEDLLSCTLCSGFWMYFILAFFIDGNVINFIQITVLREIIIGAITTFVVWLVEAGWNEKFQNLVIGG
jgi:hypothetical protein